MKKSNNGFTIIELLIVIVIIAILAAITIIAYNGITNKANAAAAQSNASQAYNKVLAYMTLNADQVPSSLTAAGVTNQGNANYTYSYNTNTAPQQFCITSTVAGINYYVNNTTQSTPATGQCPITNLATNPHASPSGAPWATSSPSGSSVSYSSGGTGAQDGGYTYRIATAQAGQLIITIPQNVGAVSAGQTYSVYANVWASAGISAQFIFQVTDGSGVVHAVSSNTFQFTYAGNYTWVEGTITIPAGLTGTVTGLQLQGLASTPVASGQIYKPSQAMVIAGSSGYATVNGYVDGSSSGWVWNGTAGNATSTGPPPSA